MRSPERRQPRLRPASRPCVLSLPVRAL